MILILAGPSAAADPALAQAPSSLQALRQGFRCELVDRLERIHAGDRSTSRNRFVAVGPRGRPDAYVQCIFMKRDAKMSCEAGRERPRDPGTLAGLGFVPDPAGGNAGQILDLGDPPDLGQVADRVLATLHDAYGLRSPAAHEMRAPLAPALRPVPLRCAPDVS